MTRFAVYYFAYFASFAVITPFFQAFLDARGFDKPQVGLLLGTFCLAGVVGIIGIGHLADHWGRRRAALLAAMAASMVMLVPLNRISTFAVALPLVFLFGVAYKSIIPLGDALAATELPDPATQYGRARALGTLGYIVMLWALTLFGWIDTASSTSVLVCFLITSAVCLPVIALLPDHHRRTSGAAAAAPDGGFDRVFALFIVVAFLGQWGMAAHYAFFTLYLKDMFHLAAPGWIWSIGAVTELPIIFCGGWFLRRFGIVPMLVASLAAMAIRLTVYALAPGLAPVVAVQVLHAATFGLWHPAAIEFLRRKVAPARQGLAMSLYMAVGFGAAQMIGSADGGFLIEAGGYRLMYTLHAIPPLLGIVLLLLARRGIGRPHRATPDAEHPATPPQSPLNTPTPKA
ncbi:MAG: MFS transporter [Planctomycetota bacterium]